MASIDQYNHKHLGYIECPSSFDFVYKNSTRKVAIYELLENISAEENDFDGKIGDILLGGGSGETATLRISIPEAMNFFFIDDWKEVHGHSNLYYKAFWTPTESYIFGNGYSKLGWTPDSEIELWLAKNLCSVLVERFDEYGKYTASTLRLKSSLTLFKE